MKSTYVYIALVIALLAGIIYIRNVSSGPTSAAVTTKYDTFAECLTNAGAKFYGAYWCPHCQDQKKLFGNSKKLPYIECSTPDGNGQVQACKDLGITGYPTWIFADGSVANGNQTFAQLAEKTSCAVPTSTPETAV